ncbi:MAG TPA: GAF domain-containing protein, partial [Thermoanaerobaculia bacterium]
LEALARVSRLLRAGLPARVALEHVLAAARLLFPADGYAVWRYHARSREWHVVVSAGLSRDHTDHNIPESAERIELENPLFIRDVFAAPLVTERRDFYEAEGFRSMFLMPLHLQGELNGTFVCYYKTPPEIADDDHELARVFANIVSAVMSARKFDRFAEAARVVSAELDLSRIVQSVTDAATEMTNAHFGAFFYNVLNAEGESYMLYSISGVPREAFERFPMPRNTAVFDPTFSGTGIVRSANIRNDPRYGHNAPHYGMPAGHLPVTSYLAVPVISRSGEVLGGLFFGHPEEGVFTENEEQIVEALAAQAAVAIDNARLYDALQRERERLMRSESRHRALVNATPAHQFIWTTSPDGRVVNDVEAWQQMTGQTADELREDGWAAIVHPQDRERVTAAWKEALEARAPMQQEFRIRVKDGSYRWVESTSAPVFAADGAILEWVGTIADVHPRKITEENLRFLAEIGGLLSSSLDYETTLRTVARLAVPEIADWCAVDIADDQGGHHRLAVAHVDPDKVELALEIDRRFPAAPENDTVGRVIKSGKSEWLRDIPPDMIEKAPLHPEHREILRALGLLSFMVVPLRVHERTLGAVTFALSDSRRHFTEADLAFAEELGRRAAIAIENARLYSAAQAANQAKDDFLATLSHELRTPMTAVLGWSRMLKMGLSAEEANEAVEAIDRSASVQMKLIEDVLDMSRIMAGKMRIDAVPVDVCAIAQSALATVHPAAAAKQIEIFTSFPREAPYVLGDEGRLQQIVWNLLTNAIKFTDPGGEVSLRLTSTGDSVKLIVRDTGAGIDLAFLPHVFERFRQQDSSTTRAHGGIGLGLAIVRHLVELHGGRISAESEGIGRGSTFTVELPAMRTRRATELAPAVSHAMPSLEGMSLLLIDDEAMTRDVIAVMLRRAGAKIVTADSVRAAQEALAGFKPDAILSDIAMPGEDGYAFLRAFRVHDQTTPVIALTAFGRPEDREKALASGFNAFIKKPVDPVVLATTLRNLR